MKFGSTNLVTDANGNLVEYTSYYPFGGVRAGGTQTDFLYTGMEKEPTGIYHYLDRYYMPRIRRWTQADNIIQDPYNPQNLNRYSYVLNNPLKYTDPSGDFAFLPVTLAGTIALMGGSMVLGGIGMMRFMAETATRPNLWTLSNLGTAAAIELGSIITVPAGAYLGFREMGPAGALGGAAGGYLVTCAAHKAHLLLSGAQGNKVTSIAITNEDWENAAFATTTEGIDLTGLGVDLASAEAIKGAMGDIISKRIEGDAAKPIFIKLRDVEGLGSNQGTFMDNEGNIWLYERVSKEGGDYPHIIGDYKIIGKFEEKT